MNPIPKEIGKEELQKLLIINFIYPISDIKWVSPLVFFPKKNGKQRICVDYRELNKAILRAYFPLPFINQLLDTLSGKKQFSFLDGLSGYNHIQIVLEDQEKTTFSSPYVTYSYKVLPFDLCNAPATFQIVVLAIFMILYITVWRFTWMILQYMGMNFKELWNLENFFIHCQETHLALSNEKGKMTQIEGIVFGRHVSQTVIKVDPAKIEVI